MKNEGSKAVEMLRWTLVLLVLLAAVAVMAASLWLTVSLIAEGRVRAGREGLPIGHDGVHLGVAFLLLLLSASSCLGLAAALTDMLEF